MNGWQPRLVALDIDGTLVDQTNTIPAPVHAAVRRVVEAGVPVVVATGRGWLGTKPIVEALGLPPGPHVSSNGAVWVRYPPFEIVKKVTFDPSDVIRQVSEVAPQALIAVEEIGVGYRISSPFPDGDIQGEMMVQSREELAASPVIRVIVRDPEADEREFLELAKRLGLNGVSYFIGWSAWLDIAPEGINKATALAEICDEFGVDAADVLAIGDGRNDIDMLRWAGRGVAVADGPPEVQEAADAVTGTFAELGTAQELERWFPARALTG